MSVNQRVNIEELLTHVPLFNGLAPEEITRIARSTREIHADKGEILFHKGDPCNGFHLLVYGQVKLAFTSSQGNEKVVEVLGPGQSFGEAIMFMDKAYILFAQTLSDSLLLHISKAAIYYELEQDHSLCKKMLAGMALRLHHLISDVESYSLRSGKQRIIGYLLREVPECEQGNKSVVINLNISKGIIASRLNLTKEHFSRILHELIDEGLIIVDSRRIVVPNLSNLRQHEG
jgi:CRP-like cAMP-binding protein